MEVEQEWSEEAAPVDAFLKRERHFHTSLSEELEELYDIVVDALRGERAAWVTQRIAESVVNSAPDARYLAHPRLLEVLCETAMRTETEESLRVASTGALITVATMQPDAFRSVCSYLSIEKLVQCFECAEQPATQLPLLSLLTSRVSHMCASSLEEQRVSMALVVKLMQSTLDSDIRRSAMALLIVLIQKDVRLTIAAIQGEFLDRLSLFLAPSEPPELCGQAKCRKASLINNLTSSISETATREEMESLADLFRALNLEIDAEASEPLETPLPSNWPLLRALLEHEAVRKAVVKTRLHSAWCAFLTRQLKQQTAVYTTTDGADIEAVKDVVCCLELLAEEPACTSTILRDTTFLTTLKPLITDSAAPMQRSLLAHHAAHLASLLMTQLETLDEVFDDYRRRLTLWAQEIETTTGNHVAASSEAATFLNAVFTESRRLEAFVESSQSAKNHQTAIPKSLNAWHALSKPPMATNHF